MPSISISNTKYDRIRSNESLYGWRKEALREGNLTRGMERATFVGRIAGGDRFSCLLSPGCSYETYPYIHPFANKKKKRKYENQDYTESRAFALIKPPHITLRFVRLRVTSQLQQGKIIGRRRKRDRLDYTGVGMRFKTMKRQKCLRRRPRKR